MLKITKVRPGFVKILIFQNHSISLSKQKICHSYSNSHTKFKMFPEKYAPKRPDDITDKPAAKEITEWLKSVESEAGKKSTKVKTALMLSGDSGIGKTALINALANEYDYEILYVNKENIQHFESYTQMSGLFNKRLLVIDNAETINFKEILNFIATSKNPIILTTTDARNKKFQGVTKFCKSIEMRKPTYLQVSKVLEKIGIAEGIAVDKKILDEISKNASGNIRSAIIDRQYWGFLRYVNKYIAGISTAKNKVNFSFVRYKFPSFLSKMSKAKGDKNMKREIGRKISPFLHIPPRLAKDYILLFSILLKKGKNKEEDFVNTYKFNDDEIEYLRSYGGGLKI